MGTIGREGRTSREGGRFNGRAGTFDTTQPVPTPWISTADQEREASTQSAEPPWKASRQPSATNAALHAKLSLIARAC